MIPAPLSPPSRPRLPRWTCRPGWAGGMAMGELPLPVLAALGGALWWASGVCLTYSAFQAVRAVRGIWEAWG